MRKVRGFTLIEAMTVVALVAILAGIGSWQIGKQLPRYRTNSAATKLVLDVRNAASIAARTNRPVTLTVNQPGCTPGYVVAQSGAEYIRVCFANEYQGVEFRDGTGDPDITCTDEAELTYPPIHACTLCTGAQVIRFLPNGQVITPSGADESIVIGPRGDSAVFDRAVGIRNLTGKARSYKRAGSGWECP